MSIQLALVSAALGVAVIAFALINPQLEVEFSAAFFAYKGNTLGLGLVLLTLLLVSYASRRLIGRIRRTKLRRERK